MHVSDYNMVARRFGNEEIELKDDEYAVIGNMEQMMGKIILSRMVPLLRLMARNISLNPGTCTMDLYTLIIMKTAMVNISSPMMLTFPTPVCIWKCLWQI